MKKKIALTVVLGLLMAFSLGFSIELLEIITYPLSGYYKAGDRMRCIFIATIVMGFIYTLFLGYEIFRVWKNQIFIKIKYISKEEIVKRRKEKKKRKLEEKLSKLQ